MGPGSQSAVVKNLQLNYDGLNPSNPTYVNSPRCLFEFTPRESSGFT